MTISQELKKSIINYLEQGKEIPEEFKDLLFPATQKEYLLSYAGKMRKEDVLANLDGVSPCPLQIDKVFNGQEHKAFEDGWKNLLVFGDNLQLLKTIYENNDSLVKDKVKGKVKLIYIDPPFATEDEFNSATGAKAYSDKKKGSEFIEFLRRRLILAKEILASDGSIFVHLDTKMSHYIKIIMDEIFGKNYFRNEIIWHYKSSRSPLKDFQSNHNVILRYTKNSNPIFNMQYTDYAASTIKRFDKVDDKGRRYKIVTKKGEQHIVYMKDEGIPIDDVWYSQIVNGNSVENCDYPTQKPEKLLERIVLSSTNPDDIVLDFFGGSGTTIAVAEKLGRRWISCDIGKLSYYTMQKRILTIQDTKIIGTDSCYGKKARSFVTAQLGIYDLEKTFNLDWDNYKSFVSTLFEFQLKPKVINGITFDGLKDGSPVMIFDFKKLKNSIIDENYLRHIHDLIGDKNNGKVYFVSPINYVDSMADYIEIEDVTYYFLKVPYHVIKELHKTPFSRSKQPKNKDSVNDLEYAVGFHFMTPPKIKSIATKNRNGITLIVENFESQEEGGSDGFDALSSIFVCNNYVNDTFILTNSYFHADLVKNSNIIIDIKAESGDSIKVIYTDIYGNEVSEIIVA